VKCVNKNEHIEDIIGEAEDYGSTVRRRKYKSSGNHEKLLDSRFNTISEDVNWV
jgi:hypothetical protein